jgi:PAS domain S-box-containing protein
MSRIFRTPSFYYGLGALLAIVIPFMVWPDLWPNLLQSEHYMPHGHCFLWEPGLIRLHLITDSLIGISYLVISTTLAFLVIKGRRNIPFNWMFFAFGVFILACGATHFMDVWTLWTPQYWLAGGIKLVTAVASVITAGALPPLVPRILRFIKTARVSEERGRQLQTHASELAAMNILLGAEVAERKVAEEKLLKAHESAISRDLSDRLRIEESLHSSDEKAREANDELSFYKYALDEAAIVAVTDAAGTISYVNDKFCEISGYSKEELVGQNHRLVNSHHHPRAFFTAMFSEIARGKVWRGDIQNRAKDGHYYWVDTTIIPTQDSNGRVTRYVAIRADISERKNAEDKISRWNAELEQRITERTTELAESNSDLEAFTYSVSHDLRAPLRAIDGFSRILHNEHAATLSNEAKRYLGLVRTNVQQMGQLLEDLLSFCRHGRQAIITRCTQPDLVVRQAWKDLTQWPDERTISFDVETMEPCNADPALLKQVFINLLSNAIKFTRATENVRITVGAGKNAEGETVYFVKDNGVGFDMRYVHKLFGVFQRLHRAEDYPGTGVGLAIVQRIIKRHNGRVWAHSQPGQGTTISFTLGTETK